MLVRQFALEVQSRADAVGDTVVVLTVDIDDSVGRVELMHANEMIAETLNGAIDDDVEVTRLELAGDVSTIYLNIWQESIDGVEGRSRPALVHEVELVDVHAVGAEQRAQSMEDHVALIIGPRCAREVEHLSHAHQATSVPSRLSRIPA